MERKYTFEGTVYIKEDILKRIAEEFLQKEGKGKDWDDVNDFLWLYYDGCEEWCYVMDDITDDVVKYYDILTQEEENKNES